MLRCATNSGANGRLVHEQSDILGVIRNIGWSCQEGVASFVEMNLITLASGMEWFHSLHLVAASWQAQPKLLPPHFEISRLAHTGVENKWQI